GPRCRRRSPPADSGWRVADWSSRRDARWPTKLGYVHRPGAWKAAGSWRVNSWMKEEGWFTFRAHLMRRRLEACAKRKQFPYSVASFRAARARRVIRIVT